MEDPDLLLLLLGLAAIALVWLLPILSIVSSSKTTGGEKLAWVLAVVFVSWFAWVFYLLLARFTKPSSYVAERLRTLEEEHVADGEILAPVAAVRSPAE